MDYFLVLLCFVLVGLSEKGLGALKDGWFHLGAMFACLRKITEV